MGSALADACIEAGAQVILVHGNITVKLNQKATIISAVSTQEMYDVVMRNIAEQDIFIACAAVSDYSVKNIAKNKIKKSKQTLTLELIPTKDILKAVCCMPQKPLCVGFAAETQNLVENAKNKLKNKGCDVIILNDVSNPDLGFKNDENELVFLSQTNQIQINKNSKHKLGKKIIEILYNNFYNTGKKPC